MKPIESKMGLITQQITQFRSEELPIWNRARDMYQGRSNTEQANDKEANRLTSSLNILFAIIESAISSLLPVNPQVTAILREESEPDVTNAPEAYVNTALDLCEYRNEQRLSLTDASLCGRSVYKTTWNAETNMPEVRAVDPRTIFFDLTARRIKDIRYFFETTVLSVPEFKRRVRMRKYHLPDGETEDDICGDSYPQYLLDTGKGSMPQQYIALKNYQQWITVYEFYDIENKTVSHWTSAYDVPLMQEKLTYLPYTLWTLNSNAQDCRGMSEALLVKSNIEDINDCMTMWINVVRRQIPSIAYDSTTLSEEEMQQWARAKIGDLTPMKASGRPLSDLFTALPMPTIPPNMPEYQGKLESNVSYVSALADNTRAQVSGARTATELALIQSQMQTRLASRQGNLDSATEDIASKILYLGSKYLGKTMSVKGKSSWIQVARKDLDATKLIFKVVPYSPLEQNRAVIEERWGKALQYMQQRPDAFDWSVIDQQFVELFRLDPNVLLPPAPMMPAPEAMPDQGAVMPTTVPEEAPEPNPQEIAAAMRSDATNPEVQAQ